MYSENDYRLYLAHHGIQGQKWGVRNGPPYPLNSSTLSEMIFKKAQEHEKAISKDVIQSANKTGCTLYGFENRIKTKASIKRKIEKNTSEKNLVPSESGAGIKDAVRYTTVSSTNRFVSNYETFKNNMELLGYKESRCKNYFDLYKQGKVKHKSVQSTFKAPDGYEFEIQFHTNESQDAKNKKLPLYEERRTLGIDSSRAAYLENEMVKLAENVPDPVGIDRIKSH